MSDFCNPLKLLSPSLFCEKFNLSQADFRRSMVTWESLLSITDSFLSSEVINKLDDIIESYSRIFRTIAGAHTAYGRRKDPLHLAEKVVRKNPSQIEMGSFIDASNYQKKIEDLVAFRILHIYKKDWGRIHDDLSAKLGDQIIGNAVAHIRTGDDTSQFEEKAVEIKNDKPYRSVHYRVKDIKTGIIFELQVRTMFEDAWGEVDHDVRYPYNVKNRALNEYLAVLNRTAGACDEMAQFLIDHAAFIKASDQFISDTPISFLEIIKKRIERSTDKKLISDIEEIYDNIDRELQFVSTDKFEGLIE